MDYIFYFSSCRWFAIHLDSSRISPRQRRHEVFIVNKGSEKRKDKNYQRDKTCLDFLSSISAMGAGPFTQGRMFSWCYVFKHHWTCHKVVQKIVTKSLDWWLDLCYVISGLKLLLYIFVDILTSFWRNA